MNIYKEIKIMTLGNSYAGKTSFILRYANDIYSPFVSPTIGIDFKSKIETMKDGKRIKVSLFDTNGQERFKSIAFNTLKNANGVLLFYDITDRNSFDSIKNWIASIYNYKDKNYPIVLIGNKIDLENERDVTKEEGEAESKKYNINFFEISCKSNINIKKPILYLISKIKGLKTNKNIILEAKNKKKKKCC